MKKAEALIHPIRLRIVQVIEAKRRATTADIASALDDVPPATLYRHLNKLLEAELVEVVESRKIRGATERTYAVSGGAFLKQEDLEGATAEDHSRWFMTFVLGLSAKFDRVMDTSSLDFAKEGIGYHTLQLWLSDDELHEMAGELNAVLSKYGAQEPGEGRRLRNFSTVLMPEPDVGE